MNVVKSELDWIGIYWGSLKTLFNTLFPLNSTVFQWNLRISCTLNCDTIIATSTLVTHVHYLTCNITVSQIVKLKRRNLEWISMERRKKALTKDNYIHYRSFPNCVPSLYLSKSFGLKCWTNLDRGHNWKRVNKMFTTLHESII